MNKLSDSHLEVLPKPPTEEYIEASRNLENCGDARSLGEFFDKRKQNYQYILEHPEIDATKLPIARRELERSDFCISALEAYSRARSTPEGVSDTVLLQAVTAANYARHIHYVQLMEQGKSKEEILRLKADGGVRSFLYSEAIQVLGFSEPLAKAERQAEGKIVESPTASPEDLIAYLNLKGMRALTLVSSDRAGENIDNFHKNMAASDLVRSKLIDREPVQSEDLDTITYINKTLVTAWDQAHPKEPFSRSSALLKSSLIGNMMTLEKKALGI